MDIKRLFRLFCSPNYRPRRCLTGLSDKVFGESGFIHLKNVITGEMCNSIINDYVQFEYQRLKSGLPVFDRNKRNYRLVNFHLKSTNLLNAICNKVIYQHVKDFFNYTPCVHTSLYFKHGSQQNAHIDTPYFWTIPFNHFVGVWFAFEDIDPDSGPLFYYPNSHKYIEDQSTLINYYKKTDGDLMRMFSNIETEIKKVCTKEVAIIKKGDVFIWHPSLLHGGELAKDKSLTRNSAVFHMAPLGNNVRNNSSFPESFFNLPIAGVRKFNGLCYLQGKSPAVMI